VDDGGVSYETHWWGVVYRLDRRATDELLNLLALGAGVAAVAALFPAFAPVAGTFAAVVSLGHIVLMNCANDRGVNVYVSRARIPWCSGR